MSQVFPEEQLSEVEKKIQKASITTTVELVAGNKVSIDGYLYLIERANSPWFSFKFEGVDPQEQRPEEHRSRYRVGDSLHLGGHIYKIKSTTGHIRYFVRLIK